MFFENEHTYYHTCPLCGANLDPNEKCDCQDDNQYDSNVTEKSDSAIKESEENKK